MFPTLFHAGPFTLHTYGLMVAFGFLAGLAAARRTFAEARLPVSLVDKLGITLLLAGILGARIMFFAVDGFAGLMFDPMAFFRIWEGGLVFYGGVIGGLVALIIVTRRLKIPFLVLTDAFAPPLLVGQAFGRLGCLAAGCCYGKICGFWPGITFTSPDSLAPRFVALHPTQLYEAAAVAILFAFAMVYAKRHPPVGRMTALYLMSYSTVRFFIEFLRGDDRGEMIFHYSPGQVTSMIGFVVGAALLLYGFRIARKR